MTIDYLGGYLDCSPGNAVNRLVKVCGDDFEHWNGDDLWSSSVAVLARSSGWPSAVLFDFAEITDASHCFAVLYCPPVVRFDDSSDSFELSTFVHLVPDMYLTLEDQVIAVYSQNFDSSADLGSRRSLPVT